jgi:ATP-dependent DNA ligase
MLSLKLNYAPMEAKQATVLPQGENWQYEPKWDGFRCIAFKDNDKIELISKSGRSLSRYFPEVIADLQKLKLA